MAIPRIDTVKLADRKSFVAAVAAAVTRLQAIETGYAAMTAAQKNTAITDMAKYLRQVIKYVI